MMLKLEDGGGRGSREGFYYSRRNKIISVCCRDDPLKK